MPLLLFVPRDSSTQLVYTHSVIILIRLQEGEDPVKDGCIFLELKQRDRGPGRAGPVSHI